MGCRSRRAGRVARRRRQKCVRSVQAASLAHQPEYVRLMKFLHQRGFNSTMLRPALFSDTGRGLQTLRTVPPGGMLVSLPESCLLTTATVLDSYLGPFVKCWTPRISPVLALCVFLVCERHRGAASDWLPYIDVLPSSYTCPAFFSDQLFSLLPVAVRRRAEEQREAMRELHASHHAFFKSLQPILSRPAEEVLTYKALRWAWCSVNTRSVYMSRPRSSFLSGPDSCALAPFLDLLNHRPDVQVKAGFNSATGCYEIRSVSGVPRHQQAFINYGSHDNQRLLLEYGFVAPCNPHSVVYVDQELLCDAFRGDRSLEQKIVFLRENQLLHDLTISAEGPGWRLTAALRLLSLPQTLSRSWRAAALGLSAGTEEQPEERSAQAAWTLSQRLLEETSRALEKISQMLQRCEEPIREQLSVVNSLRLEEKHILEKCLEALGDKTLS